LFYWEPGVATSCAEVAGSVHAVAEGACGEARQLANMAVGEGDGDSVGSEVLEPGERIGREAGLGLLTVGEDGGSGLLQSLDGVAECFGVGFFECFTADSLVVEGGEGFNQCCWTGDAADGFSRDRHRREHIGLRLGGVSINRLILIRHGCAGDRSVQLCQRRVFHWQKNGIDLAA
jgi:hypothetical protein